MPTFTPNITEKFIYTDFVNVMNLRNFTTLNIYVNSVTGLDRGPGRGSQSAPYKSIKFAINNIFTLQKNAQIVIHLAGAADHELPDGFIFPAILSPDEVSLDTAPTFSLDKRAPVVIRATPTVVNTITALQIASQADNANSGLKEVTANVDIGEVDALKGMWGADANGTLFRVASNTEFVLNTCYAGDDLVGPIVIYTEGANIAPADPLSDNPTVIIRGGTSPVIFEGVSIEASAGGAVEIGPGQQVSFIACDLFKLNLGVGINSNLHLNASVDAKACWLGDLDLTAGNLTITNCFLSEATFTNPGQQSSVVAVNSVFEDNLALFASATASIGELTMTNCKVSDNRTVAGIKMIFGRLALTTVDVADNEGGGVQLVTGAIGVLVGVTSSIQNGGRGLTVDRAKAIIGSTTDLSGATADARCGTIEIDTWAVNFRGGVSPFGVSEPLTDSSLQQGSGGTNDQFPILEDDSTPINASKANRFIMVDATAGVKIVNLPLVTSCLGLELTVKKTDVSVNVVTLDASGADLIDGAGTLDLAAQYDYVTVVAGADAWHIVSQS